MSDLPDEWRKARLQALVDTLDGGMAELGRKLDLKSGVYIGQMLREKRPITEKFIAKVHALKGYEGWFSQDFNVEHIRAAPPELDAAVDLVASALGKLSDTKRAAVLSALNSYASDPAAEEDSRQFVIGALGGVREEQALRRQNQ